MKKISRKSFLKLASAAAMSGITAGALAACNAASGSTAASSAAAKYTPGTYTATAKGMSDITMTATFSETAITDIQLDLSGETDSIGQAAKDDLIKQLLEAQNSTIDGVSGATITSDAVKQCMNDCITQAMAALQCLPRKLLSRLPAGAPPRKPSRTVRSPRPTMLTLPSSVWAMPA